MFALTSSMSYYLCPHDVDMRKGIYSLYQLVKSNMGRNPLSGEVFLFLGKNRGMIKIRTGKKMDLFFTQRNLKKAHLKCLVLTPAAAGTR